MVLVASTLLALTGAGWFAISMPTPQLRRLHELAYLDAVRPAVLGSQGIGSAMAAFAAPGGGTSISAGTSLPWAREAARRAAAQVADVARVRPCPGLGAAGSYLLRALRLRAGAVSLVVQALGSAQASASSAAMRSLGSAAHDMSASDAAYRRFLALIPGPLRGSDGLPTSSSWPGASRSWRPRELSALVGRFVASAGSGRLSIYSVSLVPPPESFQGPVGVEAPTRTLEVEVVVRSSRSASATATISASVVAVPIGGAGAGPAGGGRSPVTSRPVTGPPVTGRARVQPSGYAAVTLGPFTVATRERLTVRVDLMAKGPVGSHSVAVPLICTAS